MSFKVLKKWKTKEGFTAVVIKLDLNYNCGYIGIDKINPLYGIDYDVHCKCFEKFRKDIEKSKHGKRGIIPVFCWDGKKLSMDIVFNVHGSVTFSEISNIYPIKGKKLHWIGFDCAHSGDDNIKCDLDYCINECNSLSKQIKKFTS